MSVWHVVCSFYALIQVWLCRWRHECNAPCLGSRALFGNLRFHSGKSVAVCLPLLRWSHWLGDPRGFHTHQTCILISFVQVAKWMFVTLGLKVICLLDQCIYPWSWCLPVYIYSASNEFGSINLKSFLCLRSLYSVSLWMKRMLEAVSAEVAV